MTPAMPKVAKIAPKGAKGYTRALDLNILGLSLFNITGTVFGLST